MDLINAPESYGENITYSRNSIDISTSYTKSTTYPDLIVQNVDHPRKLLTVIKQISAVHKDELSVHLIIMGLNKVAMTLGTIKDGDDCTVLHWAALSGTDQRLIGILLEVADDVKKFIFTRNVSGNTALHLVVISACECANSIRICHKTGEDNKRYTRAYNNYKEIIRLLINAVGDRSTELIKMKNRQGRTARSLATGEIAQIIDNYHADDKMISCCCCWF